MQTDTLEAVVRKLDVDGMAAWQPGVKVGGSFGTTTHWASGIACVHKADAKETAEKLVGESREVGYIVC